MNRHVGVIGSAALIGALVAGVMVFAPKREAGRTSGGGVPEVKPIPAPAPAMLVPVETERIDTLTVLTYNTHLFAGSNAVPAQEIKKKYLKATEQIVFEDSIRADAIVQKVAGSGAAIVGLQEVWACDRPGSFAQRLHGVYPYAYSYTDGCPGQIGFAALDAEVHAAARSATWKKCFWKEFGKCTWNLITFRITKYAASLPEVADAAIAVINKHNVMNGLLLLSKYPIESPSFHGFAAGRTQTMEDGLARKGTLTATILLPQGLRLRVGVAHANCLLGGNAQASIADRAYWTDIDSLAYWTTAGASTGPAIMMGDFNVSDTAFGGGKYAQLARIFAGVGALDADRQVNESSSPTIYGAENLLLKEVFSPQMAHQRDRLDYVFYRPQGPGLRLKPESARVITDWKYASPSRTTAAMDLSDHYPVMVTFTVRPAPPPATPVALER